MFGYGVWVIVFNEFGFIFKVWWEMCDLVVLLLVVLVLVIVGGVCFVMWVNYWCCEV